MRLVCAPKRYDFPVSSTELNVVLFGRADVPEWGSVGGTIADILADNRLAPRARAWDLLSIAMSAVAADLAGHRAKSSDGWTREFALTIAVIDPDFWNEQAIELERLLWHLTTDRWSLRFVGDGYIPPPPPEPDYPAEDCVVLLSGGLDSFIGAIDLVASGRKPWAVSELVRGDAENQRKFAASIGSGLRHLQLHHNATVPNPESPPTQRARSIAFLAYGVLVATSLARYRAGHRVELNICENGFIAINPPLTGMRIGSLSTRTTHPVVIALLQKVLDAAGVNVCIRNPYQFRTKGEMLLECTDQLFLRERAHTTTSCGRFLRFGYMHCGRCVPCLVRRAAFARWGIPDLTRYKFADLSIPDGDHAGFDDVRATGIAIYERKELGTDRWLGASLSSVLIENHDKLVEVVGRGLDELEAFFVSAGVR
jgi:hypothetical protein